MKSRSWIILIAAATAIFVVVTLALPNKRSLTSYEKREKKKKDKKKEKKKTAWRKRSKTERSEIRKARAAACKDNTVWNSSYQACKPRGNSTCKYSYNKDCIVYQEKRDFQSYSDAKLANQEYSKQDTVSKRWVPIGDGDYTIVQGGSRY